MTLNSEQINNMDFRALENKFFDLLEELEIYEEKSSILSLSESLRKIVVEWLFEDEILNLEHLVNADKIEQLSNIIEKYPEIENEYKNIIDAFKYKKPATSIELYEIPLERVLSIIKDLEPFFFIAHVPIRKNSENLILLSRCRNILLYSKKIARRFKGLFDKYADMAGLLFGYSINKIIPYCLKEMLKKYDLLK